MKKLLIVAFCFTPILFSSSCNKDSNGGGGGFNIFSINDDKQLGLQVRADIAANPSEFPIIDRNTNAAAYQYLDAIRNDILFSGAVAHKDDFAWELFIIKDDETLNAFCTPGGYIYVYTGLIKYLDNKSSLAGVLGHEIAHADKRHSTEQLTKIYGLQTLVDIVLGNNQGLISEVAKQLVALSFSRANEKEADNASVDYLCPTKYQPHGAANFFEKLDASGGSRPPQFLSTHPNPENRVQNIQSYAQEKGCVPSIDDVEEFTTYEQFKNGL